MEGLLFRVIGCSKTLSLDNGFCHYKIDVFDREAVVFIVRVGFKDVLRRWVDCGWYLVGRSKSI